MDKINKPEPLYFEGNVAENWRRWKQRFFIFMTATGTDKKEAEVKSATLWHFAGPEAIEIYSTFSWETDGDEKNISKILEEFENYCTPQKNITLERHIFNTRTQQPGESIDHYVTDLRKKATSCDFGTLHDSLIRDRIVCGICSDHTRSRLLKEADLALPKAIDMCRADEITASQIKTLATPSNKSTQPELRDEMPLHLLKEKNKVTAKRKKCGWCGGEHPQGQCQGSTVITAARGIILQGYAGLQYKGNDRMFKQYKMAVIMIMNCLWMSLVETNTEMIGKYN